MFKQNKMGNLERLQTFYEQPPMRSRSKRKSVELKGSRQILARTTPRSGLRSSNSKERRQPFSVLSLDYKPHQGQSLFHNSLARFRILACGARWGKDYATTMELLRTVTYLSTTRQNSDLIPKVWVWCVAPTYALLRPVWRMLKTMTPPDLITKINETNFTMELAGDVLIELKSADRPEHLVGSGLDLLVLYEAALIPEEAWTVYLRPRLASPGRLGLMIGSGTPKGRNWWHRLYLGGQDPEKSDIWSLRQPTAENPHVLREEIGALRDSMPDRAFRQEILAEFLDDAGGVFRGARSCIVAPREVCGPCIIGIDWGKTRDYTALTAIDRTGYVTAFEEFRADYWDTILNRVAAFIRRQFPVSLVVPEVNSIGDPLTEQLKKLLPQGVGCEPFLTTAASKRDVIESLALAIEQRKISYPDYPSLINQLEIFEFTTGADNKPRYNAPPGQHDDGVISLALAWRGYLLGGQRHAPYGVQKFYPPNNYGWW